MRISIAGAACLSALLAACGGGGGGAGEAGGSAAASTRSSALADNPLPVGFGLAASRTLDGLRSSDFVPDPLRFADPDRTYVSIWQVGPTHLRQRDLLRVHGSLMLIVSRNTKNKDLTPK